MVRRVLAIPIVIVLLAAFGLPVLASHQEPGGSFTDDDGSVHEGYIEALVEADITTGCDVDLYCPDDPVTRGQMAAFLNRALPLPAGTGDSFTDDDDSIFEGDIERLAESGVTRGCNPPDNTLFCPDDPVTRGQMAAFLVRAFEYTDGAGSDQFSDDDGLVFESDIEKLAEAGVTQGCNPPDNTLFCPDNNVTRAEMATFLGRALGLTPDTPPPTTSTTAGASTSSTGDTTTTTDDDSTTTTTSATTTTTLGEVEDVAVSDNVFTPSNPTIDEGDTVRFTDDPGGMAHNVVWEDGAPGSGAASNGGWTHERTFDTDGSYAFFCVVHGGAGGIGMSGTVTVDS